uniref:Uncharacterized protein n=1 Tax=Arundo donax TaxID=35708 RepID=A0A0A9BH92_ARUDO
MTRVVTWVASP